MKILTISGSARKDSANVRLLEGLPLLFPEHQIQRYTQLPQLPLFHADWQDQPAPAAVEDWKAALRNAEGLVICTPEYLHNLPALLKNALEWVTASGELAGKKVLAISFTPHAPRGEKAMQSLLWSLQALDAQVLAQLPLYQKEVAFHEGQGLVDGATTELLSAAFELFL
ncbi:MAG: NADPH-dependent FMN reductase [Bacteroidota bacterium]